MHYPSLLPRQKLTLKRLWPRYSSGSSALWHWQCDTQRVPSSWLGVCLDLGIGSVIPRECPHPGWVSAADGAEDQGGVGLTAKSRGEGRGKGKREREKREIERRERARERARGERARREKGEREKRG